MRILLLGALGQVGHELLAPLSTFADVTAVDRGPCPYATPAAGGYQAMDVGDARALGELVASLRPDVLVNATAYTDVDGAEKERDAAFRINATAVGTMGELARKHRVGMIHISTDFVFDGTATAPYREEDATNPLGAYGASKLAGERALLDLDAPAVTLRTAWVWSLRAKSFVTAILGAARKHETMRVVSDQVGNPTFCRDLSQAIAMLVCSVRKDAYGELHALRGVYHLAGTGSVTRHELARAVLELDPKRDEHVVKELLPVGSDQYPLPAKRPLHAPLDCEKARQRLGLMLPPWRDALRRAYAG